MNDENWRKSDWKRKTGDYLLSEIYDEFFIVDSEKAQTRMGIVALAIGRLLCLVQHVNIHISLMMEMK